MKTPFKLMTLSIAGCCLVASYTQSALADHVQAVPVSAAVSAMPISAAVSPSEVTIASKAVKEQTDALTADMSIPVIEGMRDQKYQDQLNDIIARHAMEDLDIAKKQAKEDAEQAKQSGFEFRPHELNVKYEVKTNSSQTLSLKIQTYVYTGGAHGMTRIDTYNVADREQAARIELKDLFGDSHKDHINKQIQEEIAMKPENYFPDGFKGISDTQSFYMENGQAVIVFGEYEIAPYSSGRPEFRIAIPATPNSGSSNEAKPSKIVVNGKVLPLVTDSSGVTLAPLRAVAENLGYELKWNPDKQQAEVIKGDQWTAVTVGRDSFTFNKMAPIQLGAAPFINAEGNLYVPAAFFSDILKADVTSESGTLIIKAKQ